MSKSILVAAAAALSTLSMVATAAAIPPYHATAPGMRVIAAPTKLSYTTNPTECGSHLGPIVSLACGPMLSKGGVLLFWEWAACKDSTCVQQVSGFHIYHQIGGASGNAGGVVVHTSGLATPIKSVDNPDVLYVFLDSAHPDECFQATAYQGAAESDASSVMCLPHNLALGGSSVTLQPAATEVRSSHKGIIYSTGVSLAVGDVHADNEELGKIHVGYSYNTEKSHSDTATNDLYRAAFAFDLSQLQGKAIQTATLHLHVQASKLGMPQQANYNTSCARQLGLGTSEWWYNTAWPDGDFLWDLSAHGPDIQVDVTDTVRGWVQLGKPSYGFVLKGGDENLMAFTEDSCESNYDVSLDVDYL